MLGPCGFTRPLCIVSRQEPRAQRASKSATAQDCEAGLWWAGWSCSEGQEVIFRAVKVGHLALWPHCRHSHLLSLLREVEPTTGKAAKTEQVGKEPGPKPVVSPPAKARPLGRRHGERGAGSRALWAGLESQLYSCVPAGRPLTSKSRSLPDPHSSSVEWGSDFHRTCHEEETVG